MADPFGRSVKIEVIGQPPYLTFNGLVQRQPLDFVAPGSNLARLWIFLLVFVLPRCHRLITCTVLIMCDNNETEGTV